MRGFMAFVALAIFWYYAGSVIGLLICGILKLAVG